MNKPKSFQANYALSEASIKTNHEFAEANKTTSLLYKRFLQIIPFKWDRERLNKFQKLVTMIIRTGPKKLTGQRKLWDGDFGLLKGVQLNPQVGANSLFSGQISIELEAGGQIDIHIDPFKYQEVFKYHKDSTLAEVKFYFITLDLNQHTSTAKSIIALSQARDADMDETIKLQLPINNIDNQLILLIKQIYFKRNGDGQLTVIANRRYIAAEIIAVAYIKEGKLSEFQPELVDSTPIKEQEKGIWTDL